MALRISVGLGVAMSKPTSLAHSWLPAMGSTAYETIGDSLNLQMRGVYRSGSDAMRGVTWGIIGAPAH